MKGRRWEIAGFDAESGLSVFYIVVAIFLASIVVANQRDYSDSWILDGIFVPTIAYAFIFFVVEAFVKSTQRIAILTASFLVVSNLIPGLKYQLFLNPYDSTFHFRFANQLTLFGHVEPTYATVTTDATQYYVGNPGMHILMSSLSVVSKIPVNEIFRFVMPGMFGLVPLIVFLATKNILSENARKYCIIASAFPIARGFLIIGTNLSSVVYFLFFAVFFQHRLTSANKRGYAIIFIILGFTLIISHPVTPIFVALLLIGMPFGLMTLHALPVTRYSRFRDSPLVPLALLYLIMLMCWWANMANSNLVFFAGYIKLALSLGFMAVPAIPERFFEVPFGAQLRIFLVLNIYYVVIGMLILLGLLIFLKGAQQKKFNNKTRDFYTFNIVFMGIIIVYILLMTGYGFAPFAYQRFMIYLIPFGIFFAGLFLSRLNTFITSLFSRIELRNLAFASLLFILVALSFIQFFDCQPLIPKASILGRGLSENDYLVDVQVVNTEYQKQMVSFVEKHSTKAEIASDITTRWQLYGFSNGSLSSRVIWQSPLELNQSQAAKLKWDLFLLHTRKAGPFAEQVEYRTTERIENLRTNAGNLIYDNGASFIISQASQCALEKTAMTLLAQKSDT